MYVSMTGFSRTQMQIESGVLTLELSSVNHRYQDMNVRLPKEFANWEPWICGKLRAVFRRGKLNARIELSQETGVRNAGINKEVLCRYWRDIQEIATECGAKVPDDFLPLLTLPGVLDVPGCVFDAYEGNPWESVLSELIEEGVRKWQDMRQTEGEHLKQDILLHLDALMQLTDTIDRMWPDARNDALEKISKRLEEVLGTVGKTLDPDRMIQELAIITDRFDISEELARLRSHICKFIATGNEKETAGRKLDFIVQEMNREMNTIDSKVADADIRWHAVEGKAALERIREQIQNLE